MTINFINAMIQYISKHDKKVYFKTIAKFSATANGSWGFVGGETYWVRKADESDNVDKKTYCIVKGIFDNSADALTHALDRNAINRYDGTYSSGVAVPKDRLRDVLTYC